MRRDRQLVVCSQSGTVHSTGEYSSKNLKSVHFQPKSSLKFVMHAWRKNALLFTNFINYVSMLKNADLGENFNQKQEKLPKSLKIIPKFP